MLGDMFFSPRIKTKQLAGLARRVAISLGAGVDARTVWAREAEHASGRAARTRLLAVSEAVNQGHSLADALADTADYFPKLFRELAEVGEQTGHLSEVFAQLAEHYERQLELRRIFLAAIAWPLVQLGLTVLIIGFLIWVMGFISKTTGTEVDILGWNLIGNTGLLIYTGFVATVAVLLWLCVRAVGRGLVWTRPIQRAILSLPAVGKPLQTVALARLAWSLHLTFKTGMEVRHALRLSLRSTRNARYTDRIDAIDAQIAAGNSIYEAFVRAGSFPTDFLDSLAVGEQSGRLTESMESLSHQYQAQARVALAVLTRLGGFAVWLVIAAIIIALIFRLAMFYIGILNSVAGL